MNLCPFWITLAHVANGPERRSGSSNASVSSVSSRYNFFNLTFKSNFNSPIFFTIVPFRNTFHFEHCKLQQLMHENALSDCIIAFRMKFSTSADSSTEEDERWVNPSTFRVVHTVRQRRSQKIFWRVGISGDCIEFRPIFLHSYSLGFLAVKDSFAGFELVNPLDTPMRYVNA